MMQNNNTLSVVVCSVFALLNSLISGVSVTLLRPPTTTFPGRVLGRNSTTRRSPETQITPKRSPGPPGTVYRLCLKDFEFAEPFPHDNRFSDFLRGNLKKKNIMTRGPCTIGVSAPGP
ncbi:hypothetical protein BDZ91DRAFT_501831 [Kalaharituber pfeilii]|nr:hypothetical protein BDZ91DRAFT_501831 [Kalaharituber pfeilii]